MKNLIKSSTALTMSLVLALPGPVVAQGELSSCKLDGDNPLYPCTIDRQVIYSAEEMQAYLAEQQAGADAAAAEEAARVEAERQAAEQAAAEEAARLEAERQAAEQAAAEEAQRQEAERIAAEQAAAAEAERQAAEQAAAEEAQRQEAERLAAEEAQRQEAERLAAEQAAAEEAARQAAEIEERRNAEQAAAQAERDESIRQAQLEEQRRLARAAELEAAAAAAAAAEAGTAEAEVVTEEVQAEEVRRADEEFDTAVTGDAQAIENDDDDGLSKFEKALLLGLGAAVVGTVLRNGDRVVSNSGDRVVVEDPNGDLRVLKDDDALIRRPGDEVRTETFSDGSSRTIVTKPDGSRVITIRGRDGTVLRRVNVDRQGNEYVLFDDLQQEERVVVNELPQVQQTVTQASTSDEDALRRALAAEMNAQELQRFSLRQVREIRQVRALAPELELDAVRFETGSAAIRPEQARSLANIGRSLTDLIAQDPRTVILVEGHTDAVGSATYNLALSDRRAETVALALTEYFGVPPENMVTQGYGEAALKVPTLDAEPANRRAVVRNITPLLR